IELLVPPLRDRPGDVPALAEEMARRYGERFGLPEVRLAPVLLDRLAKASWPGNVRQLENTVARLVALASGPASDAAAPDAGGTPRVARAAPADAEGLSLREQVEAFERGLIARALAAAHGNQSEAARRLGTSRVTLVDKIKKYGLG